MQAGRPSGKLDISFARFVSSLAMVHAQRPTPAAVSFRTVETELTAFVILMITRMSGGILVLTLMLSPASHWLSSHIRFSDSLMFILFCSNPAFFNVFDIGLLAFGPLSPPLAEEKFVVYPLVVLLAALGLTRAIRHLSNLRKPLRA